MCLLPWAESRSRRRGRAKSRGRPSPAAAKTSRLSQTPDASPIRASSALPSRMKPGSEYSARVPGSASSGNSRQARNSASGVVAVRKNSTYTRQARIVRQQVVQCHPARRIPCGTGPSTNPGSNSPSGVSRSICPRWTSSIAAAVVATTFVRLATSNTVFRAHRGRVRLISKSPQRILGAPPRRQPARQTRTRERPAPRSPLPAPDRPRQTGLGPAVDQPRMIETLRAIAFSHGNARQPFRRAPPIFSLPSANQVELSLCAEAPSIHLNAGGSACHGC